MNLPSTVDELQRLALAKHEEACRFEQEAAKYRDRSEKLDLDFQRVEQKNAALVQENTRLIEQIRLLLKELFGPKSEKKIDPNQLGLFDEAEASIAIEPEELALTIAEHSRKKPGRKPLPEDLPREQIVHDIPEEEKTCACGASLVKIGEERSEKLKIVPAVFTVEEHIYPKYACKNCEGVEDDRPTVRMASVVTTMFPKSIATPELAAHVFIQKFKDHLPYYRQEQIFKRSGIELTRRTMSTWTIKFGEAIMPLINLLGDIIREGPCAQSDETTVQVLKVEGRKPTSKSFMWVFRGGPPEKRALLYRYHPTRSGEVPRSFFEGYTGYLQSDGYAGYNNLASDKIILVGCWAHARRKFVAVAECAERADKKKGRKTQAAGFLNLIQSLYGIEKKARDARISPEELTIVRQKDAVPILKELHSLLLSVRPTTPPEGLLGKAIYYCIDRWEKLTRYTEDGRVEIDNNAVERAIRPFVLGRKNWLFSGIPAGAEASANIYSLIETAKIHRIEPYEYFRHLIAELPHAKTVDDFEALLPFPEFTPQFNK